MGPPGEHSYVLLAERTHRRLDRAKTTGNRFCLQEGHTEGQGPAEDLGGDGAEEWVEVGSMHTLCELDCLPWNGCGQCREVRERVLLGCQEAAGHRS